MENERNVLTPEDYAEPACLLCGEKFGEEPSPSPIPQRRIVEKLDEYMGRRDFDGAERHLLYWLGEAERIGDRRGKLLVRNEMIGFYRKTGRADAAFGSISDALWLLDELGLGGAVIAGTTYTNSATAYTAFGEDEKALALFEKARTVYESQKDIKSSLLGGLYNNMALAYVRAGRYTEADELYKKALKLMENVDGGVLEQAITYLNMADAAAAEHGAETCEAHINELLDRAYALLDTPGVKRDGYYAFVCEKCAPTFSYYGYFFAAKELETRAKNIYEGT